MSTEEAGSARPLDADVEHVPLIAPTGSSSVHDASGEPGEPGEPGESSQESSPTATGDPVLEALMEDIGTTPLQWRCIAILGLANAADAVEVLAIGYILTVFEDPVSGKRVDELAGWSSLLTSAVFVGMLLGGLVSGALGDGFGRQPVLALSLLVNCAAALVSALTPQLPPAAQLPWLVFFRFVGGVGVGGSVPSAFALGSEIGPAKSRALFINVIAMFWSVGVLYTSLCAFLLLRGDESRGARNWPFFAALVAVPAMLACALCACSLEESPRYLWAHGRASATRRGLLRSLSSLGPPKPSLERRVGEELADAAAPQPSASAGLSAGFAELGRGPLRQRTVLVCGVFFFLSFSHYGVSSWISDIFRKVHFDDPYRTSIFFTAASVPGLLAATLLVDRVGRRRLTAGSMGLAGLSALLFAASPGRAAVLASAAAFNACATCAWNAVDVFSAELFPPSLRGSGLGVGSACGRVGSIAANVFISVVISSSSTEQGAAKDVAAVLFGAAFAMIGGAVCALLLPETLRHNQFFDPL